MYRERTSLSIDSFFLYLVLMKLVFTRSKLNLDRKINRVVWSLIINGILLLILAVLVVWSPLVARLLIALAIILVAYLFFYLSYRIWEIKKHFEKYLKMMK